MDDMLLVGLDIHQYVKSLCDQFLHMGITPDMTEREELAYKSGVSSALSLLEQTLNEMMITGDEGLVIHVPGLKDIEEFYSVEEIVDRMDEI